MNKKLAILGHPTRGNEVVELLEMMGGYSPIEAYKLYENRCYLINDKGWIVWDYIGPEEIDKYEIFTLEEFLEKYPYKVGDNVTIVFQSDKTDIIGFCTTAVATIKSMHWSEDLCTVLYGFNEIDNILTAEYLKLYKEGSNMKDKEDKLFDSIIWYLRNSVNNGKQYLSGGECETYFRELIKKVKENNMESCKCPEYEDIKKVAYLSINEKDYADEIEINLGDDYEYKFEMNRLYILKKKPKYPKTFEECLNMLYCKSILRTIIGHKAELLLNLEKLLICRDAYWKIAGEEMGLGKPWEPDWNDLNRKYFISLTCDGIGLYDDFRNPQVLAFPTEEMRDVFYENFKDLIEECKELL